MTPRSFFTILIKVLGIYLILESIFVIPQFISSLFTLKYNTGDNGLNIVLVLLLLLLTLGIYYIVLRFFVFKTDWIIDKLKLDKGFAEEKFELNIHHEVVLRIAIIVIGGLVLVESLPDFCIQVFNYFGQKNVSAVFGENPTAGWIIFHFVKIFLGYFMISSNRRIVNFIEKQRRKS